MSATSDLREHSNWIMGDLPVGVWVAAVPGGEFVYANETFSEIMGMAARSDVAAGEYAAPYGIYDRAGLPYPEARMPFVRAVAARETVIVDDVVIHRADGRRVYIRAHARPVFDAASAMTHVVIAFIDISQEVEAQKARAETEARLFSTQKMESIGNLAGGIAHDFNNLLASAKLMVGELRRAEHDPHKRATLEKIEQVHQSAARLTRALLGFARRGRNLARPVDIEAVIRSLDPIVERTFGPEVEVVRDIRSDGAWVVGDFSQLEQMVLNLIVNARDAMPDGGTLTVTVDRVALTSHEVEPLPPSPTGEYVILDVSDTGGGIDPAIRERIFEPYFSTKRHSAAAGSGLGLATVHGIAHGHSGKVEVRDGRSVGTTMRVTLPACEAPPRAPDPVGAVHRGTGTILLVDDNLTLLAVMAGAIRSLGYAVETASDGQVAVDLLRARPDAFRAVVLDMVMPRLDGRATYLAMRAIRPDLPVLLTTGYAFNEAAQHIIDLGVRGFIAKPFSLEEISEALQRVLSASSVAAPAR